MGLIGGTISEIFEIGGIISEGFIMLIVGTLMEIVGKLMEANEIVGKLMEANEIVGKLMEANEIVGKLMEANEIVGKLMEANEIVGKLMEANDTVGNSTEANEITDGIKHDIIEIGQISTLMLTLIGGIEKEKAGIEIAGIEMQILGKIICGNVSVRLGNSNEGMLIGGNSGITHKGMLKGVVGGMSK
jgi:hypothetical protein